MLPAPVTETWLEALEARHLAELSFPEVRRALQALSRCYVHTPRTGDTLRALDGRGKRAAFALFYAPLHLFTVQRIVAELGAGSSGTLLDLGCGTGAASAGWALAAGGRKGVLGIDRSSWALDEARWNWKRLGLSGACRRGNLLDVAPGGSAGRVVLGWTVNELDEQARNFLLERLLRAAERGHEILVVEPIARRLTPWWDGWAERFERFGGRNDDWRFPVELPGRLGELDRAAGLDHRELTARSLWLRTRRAEP